MILPQDFLDDPAGFARVNVLALYVLGGGLRKDGQKADVKYWGLTAAHAPNAVENKEHGKAYLLRVVPEDSDGAFAGYYCPYANNDWQPSMLGNKAQFMFTDQMDGCTFGVGSQGNGTNGHVLVCHVNTTRAGGAALPLAGEVTPEDRLRSQEQQAKLQRNIVRSELGMDASFIEPSTYMFEGQKRILKGTTFGFHDLRGKWNFFTLSWRRSNQGFFHGGLHSINH